LKRSVIRVLIVLAGVSFEEFSEEKTGYSNLVIDEV
jgi:hypothetical protein